MQANFSRRGEHPTLFEQGLVNHAATEQSLSEMRNAWLIIGKRIGPIALAVVLDELGGTTVHVPERLHFFRGLWQPLRDAQIVRERAAGELSSVLARRYGLSESNIRRICAGDGGSA